MRTTCVLCVTVYFQYDSYDSSGSSTDVNMDWRARAAQRLQEPRFDGRDLSGITEHRDGTVSGAGPARDTDARG